MVYIEVSCGVFYGYVDYLYVLFIEVICSEEMIISVSILMVIFLLWIIFINNIININDVGKN